MNLPKAIEDSKRHYSFLYNNPVLFSGATCFPDFHKPFLITPRACQTGKMCQTIEKRGTALAVFKACKLKAFWRFEWPRTYYSIKF
jgi:hypothetical protein